MSDVTTVPELIARSNRLATLRLDRFRTIVDEYPGVEREDEIVAAVDFCRHGIGGAISSIDTGMHGLVDAAHVDHLPPDAGIAIATAADGEEAPGPNMSHTTGLHVPVDAGIAEGFLR